MITYGCAAWFLHSPGMKWRLSKSLMDTLESIQRDCLKEIAGVFKRTSYDYILKELYIDSLEVHLERCAQTFRARALGPDLEPQYQSLVGRRPSSAAKRLEQRPYAVLDRVARELGRLARKRLMEENDSTGKCDRVARKAKDWTNSKVRAKAINNYAQAAVQWTSSERWRQFKTRRQFKGRCVCAQHCFPFLTCGHRTCPGATTRRACLHPSAFTRERKH